MAAASPPEVGRGNRNPALATGNIGIGNTSTLATFHAPRLAAFSIDPAPPAMKRLALLLPLLALATAPARAEDPATRSPVAGKDFLARLKKGSSAEPEEAVRP